METLSAAHLSITKNCCCWQEIHCLGIMARNENSTASSFPGPAVRSSWGKGPALSSPNKPKWQQAQPHAERTVFLWAQCRKTGPSRGQRAWSQLFKDRSSSVSQAAPWSLGGLSSEWLLLKRAHLPLWDQPNMHSIHTFPCQWDSEFPGEWMIWDPGMGKGCVFSLLGW